MNAKSGSKEADKSADKPMAPQPNAAGKLHAPLARLLRPLVRLCIRSGMTFPALAQLLRELFVNVAEHDFALEGKEQTDSRVSLLTGIHRKEVARLRGAGAPVHEAPAAVSLTSAVIARWLAAPEFTDAKGEPLALPRTAVGDAPSFEQLVASVTKDVRPRAVLDEWIDRKLVTINDADEIELVEAAFVPSGEDDGKWHYLGRNLHDHIAAAAENVSGAPRFLERAVHYNNISPKLARKLEARSRELAMDALKTANREANRALAKDKGGNARWNFGLYIYSEDADEEGGTKEGGKDGGKEGAST
ncbi:hypothetical protein SAMN05216338_1013116 [Bradyrhizobium sp. Rc2d]|uniref:DUF6502 family protein n=1 Tax=Bradyrhizobium sp. Rc2d TaxID=1855321 RepID=UPI0008845A98|nr:DUF6502 family protein [Bradyrhizobium sp. Rc2d]SDH79584.1 hypothetical protein SAMN05216338_1013116 [Bradyrhizobium sp. Rc2d]